MPGDTAPDGPPARPVRLMRTTHDCIATRRGRHHDVAKILDPALHGVWLETTIDPDARRGHLWEHTHGPAVPNRERR